MKLPIPPTKRSEGRAKPDRASLGETRVSCHVWSVPPFSPRKTVIHLILISGAPQSQFAAPGPKPGIENGSGAGSRDAIVLGEAFGLECFTY